jgi:hypothetical protein
MHPIAKLLGLDEPKGAEIAFQVQLVKPGRYGVFVGTVLLAMHSNKADAYAHRQRLLNQQSEG